MVAAEAWQALRGRARAAGPRASRTRGSKIAIDYGVWGLPETFIIDGEGRITYKHVGALGVDTVTAKLAEALQGIASTTEGQGEYQSVQR